MFPEPPPDAGFSFDVADRDDIAIVRATGELDLSADPLLGATLALAEARERPVVADLTAVTFCGSSTLGQLAVTATRLTAAGRPLVVVAAEKVVLRPLRLLGMDRYFTVVPDLAAALRHLGLPEAGTPDTAAAEPT
jgi:anti-sigma B factor antagonist